MVPVTFWTSVAPRARVIVAVPMKYALPDSLRHAPWRDMERSSSGTVVQRSADHAPVVPPSVVARTRRQ